MSDILIHDMEMPKSCGDCPLAEGRVMMGELVLICRINGNEYSKSHGACPLIHVPDHGRLLDESKICEMLKVQRESEYNKTHKPRVTWARAMEAFEDLLGNVDTIIPASKEGET